jgi:hypothetical protein
MTRVTRFLICLWMLPAAAGAGEAGLPLPAAAVRVVIPDVAAFDRALTGSYRRAFTGEPEEGDSVVAAWRRTQVGAKLEDQWRQLSSDLPWTWDQVLKLEPRSIGLALLDVGNLEAVIVVDARIVTLPTALSPGTPKSHAGVACHVVTRGAADGAEDSGRRMGLAWTWLGSRLLLATSERALGLAIDESLAGRVFDAPLPGLVSLDLDVDALRKDRYFRREFLFGPPTDGGHIVAALRAEGDHLVEVREGRGDAGAGGAVFDAPGAVAAAWEPDDAVLPSALRAAILEPLSSLSDRPVPPIVPLPPALAASADRYLVNLEQPPESGATWEEGELPAWRDLLAKRPAGGWGYALGGDGSRRIVFAWPEGLDDELLQLSRAIVGRRSGPTVVVTSPGSREIRVGPDLAAVALRRTGGFMWIGRTAAELADAATPIPSPDIVRWARVDLDAVRAEAGLRWPKVEGPAAPEQTRPLSDRILGLLGWMPETRSLSVERRKTENGWSERVVLGGERR